MALGTHRYMTKAEIKAKVGEGVYQRIRVFNHEWQNPGAIVDLGTSSRGTPLLVNRFVAEADVVIGIGAIVPHHIAGFSGSSKIIQPGVCGVRTTAETHLLSCSSGGDSFLGIADNPVRRDMDDMADRVGMRTIFNVVMDSQGGVIGVFFGDMRPGFLAVPQIAVPGPADGSRGRDHHRHRRRRYRGAVLPGSRPGLPGRRHQGRINLCRYPDCGNGCFYQYAPNGCGSSGSNRSFGWRKNPLPEPTGHI